MTKSSSKPGSVSHQVFVGIGSNINRRENLQNAIIGLHTAFGELLLSSIYETAAVTISTDKQITSSATDRYYNLVARFESALKPEILNQRLKTLESQFSPRQAGNCPLDLDLLLVGDTIYRENGLDIPRKDIIHYAYVAVPLAEIAGDLQHPETRKTYQQHCEAETIANQFLRRINLQLKPGENHAQN